MFEVPTVELVLPRDLDVGDQRRNKDQRWPLAPLLIRDSQITCVGVVSLRHVHGHHPYTRRIDRLRLFAARLGSAYRGDHGHLGGLWHGLRDAGEHYGNASVNDDRVHALGPPQYVDLLAPAPGHLSHITQPDDFQSEWKECSLVQIHR